MKVLKPNTLAADAITSSTVAENDYAAWNAAASYTIGDRVIRTTTHKVYESITGGVDAALPENALGGDTPKWIEVKSTNRWAMFNDSMDDATSSASDIVVTIETSGIDGIALFGLVGTNVSVTVVDNISSATIYTASRVIDGSSVSSFYDWFFVEPEFSADVIFQDVPSSFTDISVTITITKGTTAGCGVCKMGAIDYIGPTQYGVELQIIDYSTKTVDSFGYMQVVERGYVKSITAKMVLDSTDLNRVFKLLAPLRATPTVYITSDAPGTEVLIVYGYYYSFNIDISYPLIHYCTLEIHGMV